jgi:hypothetical protein
MNNPSDILFTVTGITFILLSLYGSIKLKRTPFLLGICLFSFLPIIGESIAYSDDQSLFHLPIIMAFIAQAILTIPTKPNYGSDNLAATSIAKKIGLAILFTNAFQAYMILSLDLGVPDLYGYFHIVIALIILYTITRSIKEKAQWE